MRYVPGGHIKIGETFEDGLVREYKEETGINIKVKRLLWSEECFYEWNCKQAHNIAFYYLIEVCDGFEILDNGEFVSHKDNCNVVIGCMDIDEALNRDDVADLSKSLIKCALSNNQMEIKEYRSSEKWAPQSFYGCK